MKKHFRIIPVFIILLALCLLSAGCEKSGYKKAMKLIDEGSYAAARELLIQMGDYEDSAERVKELSYRIVAEAVRSAGEEYEGKYRVQKQIVSSTGADAVVSIYAVNDSSIALNYDYENTITGFYAKVSCTTAFAFDSDSMPVEYSRTMALKLFGKANTTTATGRGAMKKSEFTRSSKVHFDTFNSTETIGDTSQTNVEDVTADALNDMLPVLSDFLKEKAIDITLKDLGFDLYE